MKPKRVPKYRRHKTGQARVTLNGRDVWLGKYGSPESHEKYNRVIAEWMMGCQVQQGVTITELIDAYLKAARQTYKVGLYNRGEAKEMGRALAPLSVLYGSTKANEFSAKRLMVVRSQMITHGWSRRLINHQMIRCRRLFKWAALHELCSAEVWQQLRTMQPLRAGTPGVKERPRVKPVALDVYQATLPHLSPRYAAMAQIQYLAGCRPGEVCNMRPMDLDKRGDVWLYTPESHKNEWRGLNKVIPLGPLAQALLTPWLGAPEAHVFPRLPLYYDALRRACQAAGVPPWSPNQLRHTRATEMSALYGLETAAHVLGDNVNTAKIYAERAIQAAIHVARERG